MRYYLALAACLIVAAEPALAAKTIVRRGYIPGGVPALPCTIVVDFTSGGAGPDLDGFEPIRSYVIDTENVDQAEAWGWGKEGEFSLCLTVHDTSAAKRIFEDLTRLKPAKPGKPGSMIEVRQGANWKT